MPKPERTHHLTIRVTFEKRCGAELAEKLLRERLNGSKFYFGSTDGMPGLMTVTAVKRQPLKPKPKKAPPIAWE